MANDAMRFSPTSACLLCPVLGGIDWMAEGKMAEGKKTSRLRNLPQQRHGYLMRTSSLQ